MIKSTLNQRLSLRCKLKDANTIEICVIESATGTIYLHRLKFRQFPENLDGIDEACAIEADPQEVVVEPQEGDQDEDD